ncbi:MAG TPA: hypothetical protein VHG91_18075 [Longimicrobium sp.]|nr:hypothetical protein [Longimicrobium sp.]
MNRVGRGGGCGTWRAAVRPARLAAACAAVAIVAACGGGPDPVDADPGGGPSARPLFATRLGETAEVYLARPRDLWVEPGGDYLVSDAFFNRVVRFDRGGAPRAVYGAMGRGPGEFTQVGIVFSLDTLLVATDYGRGVMNAFDPRTGAVRWQKPLEGIVTSALRHGGEVWFGAQDMARRSAAIRWSPGTGEHAHVGALPAEYLRSPALAGIYTGGSVARWADTVMVGMAGGRALRLYAVDGRALGGGVVVPARRRRGVPADVAARIEKLQFPEMFSLASVLFQLNRAPGGAFNLVHYDQEIEGRQVAARVWVSRLSPDRARACVDREVPVSRDAQPVTALRGDTLFVVEQAVDGEAAVTTLRAWLIGEAGCRWVPTERG